MSLKFQMVKLRSNLGNNVFSKNINKCAFYKGIAAKVSRHCSDKVNLHLLCISEHCTF